jgi:hypothetical protein
MSRLAGVLLIAAISPVASIRAQLRAAARWPSDNSWVTTTEATCGEVRGRAIRWPSGFQGDTVPRPMPFALVSLIDSAGEPAPYTSRQRAALVNAGGEFRLPLPPSATGYVSFLVRGVGYQPAVVALDTRRYRAFVVEVLLRSAGLHDPQLGLSVHAVRGVNICTP